MRGNVVAQFIIYFLFLVSLGLSDQFAVSWGATQFPGSHQFFFYKTGATLSEKRGQSFMERSDWPRTSPPVTIGCTPEFEFFSPPSPKRLSHWSRSVARRRLRETVKDPHGSAGKLPKHRLIGSRWRQRTAALAKKDLPCRAEGRIITSEAGAHIYPRAI